MKQEEPARRKSPEQDEGWGWSKDSNDKLDRPFGRSKQGLPTENREPELKDAVIRKHNAQTPGWRSGREPSSESTSRTAGDQASETPVGEIYRPLLMTARRRPNPFEDSSSLKSRKLQEGSDHKRITLPGLIQTQAEKPWGLSKEDAVSVESFLEPGSQEAVRESPPTTKKKKSKPAKAPKITSSATQEPSEAAKLTHLTSSGEAHMVDVGAKPSTRRVAVAFGTVHFSNSEPFRLIQENSNKKGDVLGTARIAGIMAAKRTSDLIPLCHPLSLTKVEVEVTLHETARNLNGLSISAPQGLVAIQALVECTGPTGVEMEALTALSGAAMTVYDMCKAVDRKMMIRNSSVVYKSGGRSGIHSLKRWENLVGKEFFEKRGLERGPDKEEKISGGGDGSGAAAVGVRKKVEEKESLPPQEETKEETGAVATEQGKGMVVRRVAFSAAAENPPRNTTDPLVRKPGSRTREDYASLWQSPPSPISPPRASPSAPPQSRPSNPTPTNSSSSTTTIPCKVCATPFPSMRELRKHFRTAHGTGALPKQARPTKCRVCETEVPYGGKELEHLVEEHGWSVRWERFERDVVPETGAVWRGKGDVGRVYRPPPTPSPSAL